MRRSLVDRRSVERLLLVAGALRSGLIDVLAGEQPLSAEQVAASAKTDVRASTIVLEALTAEEVVERTLGDANEALYRLSQLGRTHLVDEGPGMERFGLLLQAHKVRGWLELPEIIRTGKAAPRDPAKRDVRCQASAMGERDPAIVNEIVERCLGYAGEVRTMLDVGGAVGHVARGFLRRGVRPSLLDREDVLPVAREFLGVEAGGIALLGGDYTLALPPGPFDLVYFGNVYHIYGPDINARVSQEAFGITSPGGTIAVQDHVWGRTAAGALFAVNMLQSTTDGGVWTEAQYQEWLGGAGFEGVEVLDLESTASQLVLGRRPGGLSSSGGGQV